METITINLTIVSENEKSIHFYYIIVIFNLNLVPFHSVDENNNIFDLIIVERVKLNHY